MTDLEDLKRRDRELKKPERLMMNLPPALRAELERLALEQDRPLGYVARHALLDGLLAQRRGAHRR